MTVAIHSIQLLVLICIACLTSVLVIPSEAIGAGPGCANYGTQDSTDTQEGSPHSGTPPSDSANASPPDDDEEDDEDDDEFDRLLDADLETLSKIKVTAPEMNLEVTSVSRTQVAVGKTPAAITVITQDMIRRSGAVTLPDVLRMVPGMQVARQSNGTWSIGARGAAGTLSRSLQVQVDGRSIYDARFGGVYWNVQDILLSDIDRIEIIRGPGASVWGVNAVDGIINIMMKNSSDTQGILLQAATGTELNHQGSFRVGGKLERGSTYRVFGRFTGMDGGELVSGADEFGGWNSSMLGLRMDGKSALFDKQSIQTGVTNSVHDTLLSQPALTPPNFFSVGQERQNFLGWHALASGTREISDDESYTVRSYFDSLDFAIPSLGDSRRTTADVDIQHQFKRGDRHSIVWGANFRHDHVDVVSSSFRLTNTEEKSRNIYGVFAQDTIKLRDDLAMTLGAKLSYNDFTGTEFQPTGRLVWNPTEKLALWTAVSKSVRLPAIAEGIIGFRSHPVATTPLPTFPFVLGNPNLNAEDNFAVEAGIRGQPNKDFYWDLNAYYFQLSEGIEPVPNGSTSLTFPPGFVDVLTPYSNLPDLKNSGGMELYMKYGITDAWELSGNYTYAAIRDSSSIINFPRNSVYLQSSFDLNACVDLDLIWRYRDNIPISNTRAYNDMDIRLAWRPRKNMELSLVGRNLLNPSHFEEGFDSSLGFHAGQVQRELFGTIQWRF